MRKATEVRMQFVSFKAMFVSRQLTSKDARSTESTPYSATTSIKNSKISESVKSLEAFISTMQRVPTKAMGEKLIEQIQMDHPVQFSTWMGLTAMLYFPFSSSPMSDTSISRKLQAPCKFPIKGSTNSTGILHRSKVTAVAHLKAKRSALTNQLGPFSK
jgi:hypothetical protein